ncbi:MAG: FKBP-type peptidyl-prolyl cis-trans isomerase [SAR86 cluster bacterium]|nr:FKBP-type peptidyl-prolyl cis-trans isomerase [SAR86 cluster bacterium]MDO7676532.1 FKBP-type peptidyl-prolyl cis-trans isomerase [Gammaproteobacteria bacterium]MDO7577516.1 FKBP-type peptidyl-prolyl cis-trans isomerase [SAR86 cluster bacterium]MDO7600232.1 FKBP-type peptidyl-prolyl cis-trans isomerase [SAR86 cluster bacterium]MDO7701926.1 FKBP-type peptidyl-prolyl cis-trans isomerase [SAR86 cluster bacterium]
MKNICITLGLIILMTSCSPESKLEINLQQSEVFLENNLLDSSIVEIEPGLQYVVLESSQENMPTPKLSDIITADFHGTLMDGSIFWSSIEIGEPLTIQLSQLIPGCQKLISRMREGDFWRVFIHPDMAYGEEGRPTIPPNSALIFDIKLHAIQQNPRAKK